MWALFLLIALIIVFIASIIVLVQGNIYALLFVFIFGAIIVGIIVSIIKAFKNDKSKIQQDKINNKRSLEQNTNDENKQVKKKYTCICGCCVYFYRYPDGLSGYCNYHNKITYVAESCVIEDD